MGADRIVEATASLSEEWEGRADDPEVVLCLDPVPLLAALPAEGLRRMREAGDELLDIYRVLAKSGDNVVGLLLKDVETFYEWDHYPAGDVYDRESHGQYYYHAHRGASGEHGHFHTFLRAKGMPAGVRPLPLGGDAAGPAGEEALAHLVAISMDRFGVPTHLFTTNRWVTGETLYGAPDVIRMLDRFEIDLVWPNWPLNRWISALMVLFRPQVEQLLLKRDAVLRRALEAAGTAAPLEDRALEITAIARIDADEQIAAVDAALGEA